MIKQFIFGLLSVLSIICSLYIRFFIPKTNDFDGIIFIPVFIVLFFVFTTCSIIFIRDCFHPKTKSSRVWIVVAITTIGTLLFLSVVLFILAIAYAFCLYKILSPKTPLIS